MDAFFYNAKKPLKPLSQKQMRLTIVILFSILSLSCNNSAEHEKYIQEYVSLQKPSYHFLPIFKRYRSILRKIDSIQQNESKANLKYLDSLSYFDKLMQDEIENDIKTTQNIVELDDKISAKDKTLGFLNSINVVVKKSTVKYSRICELGSDSAKATLSAEQWDVMSQWNIAVSAIATCAKALNQFQIKHIITNSEMFDHGLPVLSNN